MSPPELEADFSTYGKERSMADQYISTSRLANVIQLIALGRQSGILRVVRGHGASREMGQIQFIDGQPRAALLGQLTGTTAMNVLNNWGESYYMFDESEMSEEGMREPVPAPAYGAWPSGDAGWSGRGTVSRLGGGGASAPSGAPPGYPASYPGTYPGGNAGSWPSQNTGASLGQNGQMGQMPQMPHTPTPPPTSGGPSGPLPGNAPTQPAMGSSYPPSSYPSQPGDPGSQGGGVVYPGQVPRRTARSELSDPLPLDRRERMVLLLVDGRRSVGDLSRLTRRSEPELLAVLGNLKMLGLIE